MKVLACLCFLLFASCCLSETLPEKYCKCEHKEKVEECIKEGGEEKFEQVNEIAKKCREEHLPHITEIGPHHEEMCAEIETEGGHEFGTCFDSSVEEHGIKELIVECMEKHH